MTTPPPASDYPDTGCCLLSRRNDGAAHGKAGMQGRQGQTRARRIADRLSRFCTGFTFTVLLAVLRNFSAKPPMGTDSLIYHLPIPALWMQHGFLAPVEVPLHDGLCEHSPLLFHCIAYCLMRLTGDDGLVVMIQPLCFFGMLWLFYRSARLVGASRHVSWVLTSAMVLFNPFVMNWRVCNNDLLLTLGAALLLHGILRLAQEGAGAHPLYMAATGIAIMLATKHVGVVYAGVGLGLVAAAVVQRQRAPAGRARRLPTHVLFLAGMIASVGLVFHIRTMVLHGNPFYPNTVRFAGVELFPGLFDLSVFRDHGWTWSALRRVLLHEDNVFALRMPVSGILWLGVFVPLAFLLARQRRLVRLPQLAVASLFPLASVVLYLALVPFWQHHRLLFPVYYSMWLGVACAAALLAQSRPGDGSETRVIFGVLLLYVVQALLVPIWTAPGFGYALGVGVAAAAFPRVWPGQVRTARRAAAAAAGAVALASPLWYGHYQRARARVRSRSHEQYYGPMGRAWNVVDDVSSGQLGVTVAYAGTALIYPLFGARLQNRVVYLGTSDADRPGPVQFRRGEEQCLSVVKARRARFDEGFWLRQVEHQQVQLIYLVTDDQRGGVEHELSCIARHPDRFRVLYGEEDVVLCEVLPRSVTD